MGTVLTAWYAMISCTNLVTDWAVHLLLIKLLAVTTSACILLSIFKLLLVECDAAAYAARDNSGSFLALHN